jgi:[ribosomal protein S18]-alanine N-acetyltransferase
MTGVVHVEPMNDADVCAVAAIDASVVEEQLRAETGRAWSRRWVARQDGDIVGFLFAWHVVDELHVMNIAARADRRRRGIGRALMDGAMSYARANGVARLLLEVRRSNAAALALYRTTGFHAVNVRRRDYPDDEDAVEMVLILDPHTHAVILREDEVDLHG